MQKLKNGIYPFQSQFEVFHLISRSWDRLEFVDILGTRHIICQRKASFMKIWKIYANRGLLILLRYKWHSSAETFDVRQRLCHFRQLILEHDTKIIIHTLLTQPLWKSLRESTVEIPQILVWTMNHRSQGTSYLSNFNCTHSSAKVQMTLLCRNFWCKTENVSL